MIIHKRTTGTAIFMALMVVAIVAGIATVLQRLQQIDIRRTTMMLNSDQSYLYSQGVVDWAKASLIADLATPITTWPHVMRPSDIAEGQGKISGVLIDAEGLFNINNFAQAAPLTGDEEAKQSSANEAINTDNTAATFKKLLAALNIGVAPDEQEKIVAAITAWTSSPQSGANVQDPFDTYYMQANPAYRAPHAMMISISELRLVAGMTAKIYNALLPYVTALPTATTLNTDHAPGLLKQISGIQANQPPEPGQKKNNSQYFLLQADVILEDQHLALYTMLQRIPAENPKDTKIVTLWQSFGTL